MKDVNSENKFVLFSRFGMSEMYYGDWTDYVEYKINDEAIRYDRIKKIYICGTGNRVFVDTYDGSQYVVETDDLRESNRIFREILHFPQTNKLLLDYTKNGKLFFEAASNRKETINIQ